nr:hypothetical protein [Candidatus Eremiobacteraeota bacterium]
MIAWLAALLLGVASAASAEAVASPSPPAASPLPEIGRVRVNAACQSIVEHARVAITNAAHNDRRLRSLATVMD